MLSSNWHVMMQKYLPFWMRSRSNSKRYHRGQQELSYRQQIARRLRIQYAEGIYKHKYYTVILKPRLRVTKGHWKRNHWIDHTRLSSSRVTWRRILLKCGLEVTEGHWKWCQTPRSMYPSIFNSSPVIRTASAKNRRFHVPQPTFRFPWRRPCDYHAVCSIDGETIQCLPNPSQHVPIYLQ